MKRTFDHLSTQRVWGAIAVILFSASACKLGPSPQKKEQTSASRSAAEKNASDPSIDLNCIIDHIQNPPEAFHYSYKKDNGDDQIVQEADLTPDTIDGFSKNKDISRVLKGVRSDRESWQSAWTGLTGISGMSSTIAVIRNSSAIVREAAERINGYDTVRYSIDTSRATTAEAGLYRITLGDGGFEKGTAWVNSQGCPVKLILDSEMHFKNGTANKSHYEIEMIKK
jgi:hypothetical protein